MEITYSDYSVPVSFTVRQPVGLSIRAKWAYRKKRLLGLRRLKRVRRSGALEQAVNSMIHDLEREALTSNRFRYAVLGAKVPKEFYPARRVEQGKMRRLPER